MVSVIIPVYNVEKYIDKCLESVVNQTYKNLEIIVINDGSTDESEEVIKKYLNKHSNIKYIYQENKGVSSARNAALTYANGKYVMFIDSDDYIDKYTIEKMYFNAEKYDSDMVVCGHVRFYDDISRKEIFNYYNYQDRLFDRNKVFNLMLELKVKGYLCDKLFKRESLINNNFVLEPNRYIEDWFPVIKYVSKCDNISFVGEPLYYYRQRSSSALHTIKPKLLEDYVYAVNNIQKFIETCELIYNKESKQVFDCETYYSILRYFYIINIKSYKNKFEMYTEFNKYIILKNIKRARNIYFNQKLSLKTKLKLILWDFRLFHFIYKY